MVRIEPSQPKDVWVHECSLRSPGCEYIAGVDEAGRGPLAGPVVIAAVILPLKTDIPGLADSKTLTARQREHLYDSIQRVATGISVVSVLPETIDRLNILQATLLGMRQAVSKLWPVPDHVLVDGNRVPTLTCPCRAIVKGDSLSASIAAASIMAKVTRDRQMMQYELQYPGYGFAKHKGYPTRDHYAALEKLGACEIHRRSFRLFARNTNRDDE